MTQLTFRTAAAGMLLAAVSIGSAQAQNGSTGAPAPFRGQAIPVQSYQGHHDQTVVVPQRRDVRFAAVEEGQSSAEPAPIAAPAQVAPGYPYLNAPLYACPRPDVPYQMGGAVITNQALSPHEMLYAHEYKAMYPPFYYRARGGWIVTPFGVHSHENWKLQGTVVKVKYRSRYGLLSGFHPPVVR